MASIQKNTTDVTTIREWAEERGGVPACVEGTSILRIMFEDTLVNQENLEETDWEKFTEVFNTVGLAMVYEEETKEGNKSRFYKFVDKNSLNKK